MLGQRAGGFVSCLYTLYHQAELAGLICESFAQELPAPDFVLAVFKGMGHFAPHAHILHLPNERFSRDPKAVQVMNEDPLIAHETQPSQTVAAMVRADERLKRDFPLITLPVLILHGTLRVIRGKIRTGRVIRGKSLLRRSSARTKRDFPLITLPVLILHGTLDKNTRPSGSQQGDQRKIRTGR